MNDRIEAAARAIWARVEDEVSFDEAKAANDEPYQWTLEDARVAIAAADAAAAGPSVTLTYTNWRGETADRTIIPMHVWFGATEWHPEPQWLLRAIDVEKNAERDFSLKDFGAPPASNLGEDSERLRKALTDVRERLDGEPAYHHQGMGCGLEDRNIHDRYQAMQHGWDCAMERTYAEHVTPAIEVIDAALQKGSTASFQERLATAHVPLFHDDPTDIPERRARFFEESGETCQAFGMTREEAHALVDYTWDRPAGQPEKEIGASVVTLASLCIIAGHDMMACAEADLAKLQRPESIARIRAKRATRHGRGPLPGLDPTPSNQPGEPA